MIAARALRFWNGRRLATKILLVFLPLLLLPLLAIGVLAGSSLQALGESAISTTSSLGARTGAASDTALRAYTQANLAALAADQATISDAIFEHVASETELLASYASAHWESQGASTPGRTYTLDIPPSDTRAAVVELIAPETDRAEVNADLQRARQLALLRQV